MSKLNYKRLQVHKKRAHSYVTASFIMIIISTWHVGFSTPATNQTMGEVQTGCRHVQDTESQLTGISIPTSQVPGIQAKYMFSQQAFSGDTKHVLDWESSSTSTLKYITNHTKTFNFAWNFQMQLKYPFVLPYKH